MAYRSISPIASLTTKRVLPIISLAIVIVTTPLFFWGGPTCAYCIFYQAVWNLGHPLFFGFLMLAIRPWRFKTGWRLWIYTTLTVIIVGSMIEYLQGLVGRDMDIDDVYRDLTGTWFILAWQTWSPPSHLTDIRRLLCVQLPRLLATMLIAGELISVALTGLRQWKISHQLPSLYDFQQSTSAFEWKGNIRPARNFGQSSYYPLLVRFSPGHYPSVFLNNMPHDWSGYTHLEISLFNPAASPIRLTLRINDAEHDQDGGAFSDRFNQRLMVRPGENHYSISLAAVRNAPHTRKMNMKKITRLGIFATNLTRSRFFYIKRLELYR